MLRCLLPAALLLFTSAFASSAQPNILLILADDLGYADTGFQGSREIPTPHLDALAARGVRFTQAYVTHPSCSPSRAGLLTGRYQQRFGHEYNPMWLPNDTTVGLPLTERTLADDLRAAGYRTAVIGKWHLGAHPQFHPHARGFDHFYGILGGGHNHLPATKTTVEYEAPLYSEKTAVPHTGFVTDQLTDAALAWLAAKPAPFFLFLSYTAPHAPLDAPPADIEKLAHIADPKRRAYAALVTTMDAAIGRVLEQLRASGQLENTLVVFLSDNGGPTSKRSPNHASNLPLRGQKGDVFEGGVRVPFLISWPAQLAPGVYPHPVSALDLFPTFLAAAHATRRADAAPLDGANLLPLLENVSTPPPTRTLHWRVDGGYAHALRSGSWKWMRVGEKPAQLFDLETDPYETKDIAAEHAERAAQFAKESAAWSATLVEPVFVNQAFRNTVNE